MKRSGSTASVQAVAPVEIAQRNDPLHGHFVCLRRADVEIGGACCVSECTDGEQGTGEREEDLRYAAGAHLSQKSLHDRTSPSTASMRTSCKPVRFSHAATSARASLSRAAIAARA